MRHPKTNRSVVVLFMILLIGCGGLIVLSAPSASSAGQSVGKVPIRLSLKVERGTLPSGESTKISVYFLDRDYQSVPNDGSRVIEFGTAAYRGQQADPNAINPRRVTVKSGASYAETTFTSRQPGKVVITASTAGLESAQTMLVVIAPAASMLSGLFETVASAAPGDGFDIWPEKFQETFSANEETKATFKLNFTDPPAPNTKIRIRVDSPAIIVLNGQKQGQSYDLPWPEGKADSDEISVVSRTAATFEVSAFVLPSGEPGAIHLPVTFVTPRPTRLDFDTLPQISPNQTAMIRVFVTDRSHIPLMSDKPRTIHLSSEDDVEFTHNPITVSPTRQFAEFEIRLKEFPLLGKFKLRAWEQGDDPLDSEERTVTVFSAVEKLILTPPPAATRGENSDFTVRLVDKAGNPQPAEWPRTVYLNATGGGRLSQPKVTFERGQHTQRVHYVSPYLAGSVLIKAEEDRLPDALLELPLVTPPHWLLLAVLFGSLVGGVARYLPKGDTVGKVLPTFELSWKSVAGSIAGSLISGCIFYLAMKLGLSRALGFLLPASFDVGTGLAAIFLACIGGYLGIGRVFDGIASLWSVFLQKKSVSPPPIASRMDHGARL